MEVIVADKIFTGEEWLTDHALIVEEGLIVDTVPAATIAENIKVVRHHNSIITPALIDLQIYGAKGSLFAVEPTVSTLQKMYEYCLEGGAAYFQPTVATITYDVIYACIDAVRLYSKQGGKGVIGLHIEGPWINPVRKGAHVESFIHSPTLQQVEDLLEYSKGVISMITLAPEMCSKEGLEVIKSHGVVVSAGHTNATYEEATGFFNAGIGVATHLYNAMSPLHHRSPGMVGAILDHETVISSIVADGFHVDFAAIRIAKKLMKERLFYITDAVTQTNTGFYQHQLVCEKYESNGILSGSALTMIKAVQNGVEHAGISIEESLRMGSLYPAIAIKQDLQFGKIKKGYKASYVVLATDLSRVRYIAG